LQDIEIIIKSHLRQNLLIDYLNSIRECFDGRVVVADDSPMTQGHRATIQGMAELHDLEDDVGLSAGRNYLVDQVKSDLFLLSDDDHIINSPTFLDEMRDCMDRHQADIVSASVLEGPGSRWFGHYTLDGSVLTRNLYQTDKNEFRCRICPNFFLARTQLFRDRKLRWAERLKMGEHDDFFLRIPNVVKIIHYKKPMIRRSPKRESNPDYNVKRWEKMEEYRAIVRKKYGLSEDIVLNHIQWDGGEPPPVPNMIRLV
jgi:GT2 family glycosyltransferase